MEEGGTRKVVKRTFLKRGEGVQKRIFGPVIRKQLQEARPEGENSSGSFSANDFNQDVAQRARDQNRQSRPAWVQEQEEDLQELPAQSSMLATAYHTGTSTISDPRTNPVPQPSHKTVPLTANRQPLQDELELAEFEALEGQIRKDLGQAATAGPRLADSGSGSTARSAQPSAASRVPTGRSHGDSLAHDLSIPPSQHATYTSMYQRQHATITPSHAEAPEHMHDRDQLLSSSLNNWAVGDELVGGTSHTTTPEGPGNSRDVRPHMEDTDAWEHSYGVNAMHVGAMHAWEDDQPMHGQPMHSTTLVSKVHSTHKTSQQASFGIAGSKGTHTADGDPWSAATSVMTTSQQQPLHASHDAHLGGFAAMTDHATTSVQQPAMHRATSMLVHGAEYGAAAQAPSQFDDDQEEWGAGDGYQAVDGGYGGYQTNSTWQWFDNGAPAQEELVSSQQGSGPGDGTGRPGDGGVLAQPFVRSLFGGTGAAGARRSSNGGRGSGGAAASGAQRGGVGTGARQQGGVGRGQGGGEGVVVVGMDEEKLQRLEKLEQENAKLQQERASLSKMRQELERAATRLEAERSAWEHKQMQETGTFEAWRTAEVARLERDRRVLDKQSKALLKLPTKKERSAVEAVEAVLEEERREARATAARHKLTVERLRRQLIDQQEKNRELREEIRWHEAQRLSLGWSSGPNQQPPSTASGGNRSNSKPTVSPPTTRATSTSNVGVQAELGAESLSKVQLHEAAEQLLPLLRPAVAGTGGGVGRRLGGRIGRSSNGGRWGDRDDDNDGWDDDADDGGGGGYGASGTEQYPYNAPPDDQQYNQGHQRGPAQSSQRPASAQVMGAQGAGRAAVNNGVTPAHAGQMPNGNARGGADKGGMRGRGGLGDDENGQGGGEHGVETKGGFLAQWEGDVGPSGAGKRPFPGTLPGAQGRGMAEVGPRVGEVSRGASGAGKGTVGAGSGGGVLSEVHGKRLQENGGGGNGAVHVVQMEGWVQGGGMVPKGRETREGEEDLAQLGSTLRLLRVEREADQAANRSNYHNQQQQNGRWEENGNYGAAEHGAVQQASQGHRHHSHNHHHSRHSHHNHHNHQLSTTDTLLGDDLQEEASFGSHTHEGEHLDHHTSVIQAEASFGSVTSGGGGSGGRHAEHLQGEASYGSRDKGAGSLSGSRQPTRESYSSSSNSHTTNTKTISQLPEVAMQQKPAVSGHTHHPSRHTSASHTSSSRVTSRDEIVRSMRHPDGKVEHFRVSGRRDVSFANGTYKVVLPGGLTGIRFLNGDIKHQLPNGETEYYYAEVGVWHTTYSNGLEVFHFPSGQVEAHHPGGGKELVFPDGAGRRITLEGEEIELRVDQLCAAVKAPCPTSIMDQLVQEG